MVYFSLDSCGQNTPTALIHILFHGNLHFLYEVQKLGNTKANLLDMGQPVSGHLIVFQQTRIKKGVCQKTRF